MNYCTQCGVELKEDDAFCGKCGAKVKEPELPVASSVVPASQVPASQAPATPPQRATFDLSNLTGFQTLAVGVCVFFALALLFTSLNGPSEPAQESIPMPPRQIASPPDPKSDGIITTAEAMNMPLEYVLAVLNARKSVSANDITIARFRSLLSQLDSTFQENPKQIADLSVHTRDSLKEEGVEETLLNIMEGMNSIFPGKAPNPKLTEYSAFYIVARKKGSSHDDSISQISALVRGLGG